MKCTNCGIEMVDIASESMEFTSKLVGKIVIPNVPKRACRSADCDTVFISSETTKLISEFISNIEARAIDELPIGEFISCLEASELLGITKQAFSKKIKNYRNRFIIKSIDGKDLFYRKSIEKYASDNDGRMLIKFEFHQNEMINTYIEYDNVSYFLTDLPITENEEIYGYEKAI